MAIGERRMAILWRQSGVRTQAQMTEKQPEITKLKRN
jgi:hypothetical protein